MSARIKQALVLGGLVAGAFGLATLLNKRRRKRPAQVADLAELELDAELEGLRHEARTVEPAP
jgi:hypothetical protein